MVKLFWYSYTTYPNFFSFNFCLLLDVNLLLIKYFSQNICERSTRQKMLCLHYFVFWISYNSFLRFFLSSFSTREAGRWNHVGKKKNAASLPVCLLPLESSFLFTLFSFTFLISFSFVPLSLPHHLYFFICLFFLYPFDQFFLCYFMAFLPFTHHHFNFIIFWSSFWSILFYGYFFLLIIILILLYFFIYHFHNNLI